MGRIVFRKALGNTPIFLSSEYRERITPEYEAEARS
jgi:hypothetical protein